MTEDKFLETVALAQHIEENALEHAEYSGPLDVRRVLDFSPDRYSGMSFDDLLVLQERVEKVIRTSNLNIYSTPREVLAPEIRKQSREVENRVKEITTETLHHAEEMKLEMEKAPEPKSPEQVRAFVFEKPEEVEEVKTPQPPAEEEGGVKALMKEPEKFAAPRKEERREIKFEPDTSSLSFEEETPLPKETKEPEISRPIKKPAIEFEKTLPTSEAEVEKPAVPADIQKPFVKPEPRVVPPVLAQDLPEQSTFDRIQQAFDSEWGGERDDMKIRRKMLELTKDLFREKSTSKREQIKQQIVVLKNMLAQPVARERPKEVTKDDFAYANSLFITLANTLASEFGSALNALSIKADSRIAEAKRAYSEAMMDISEPDADGRKAAFDKYVFDLTRISEEIKAEANQLKTDILIKHQDSLDQYVKSLDDKDSVNRQKAEDKKESLDQVYPTEIASFVTSLSGKTSSLIDTASHAALAPSEGPVQVSKMEAKTLKKTGMPQAEVDALVAEINSTDEGTLLYHLHFKNLARYKDFERGRITKQQALLEARRMIAKEKGLNDSIVNKNWGEG